MDSKDLIYRQLQKVLDERLPVGFPATDSGIEIRVLKHLFTPEEGEIAIYLTVVPEPLEEIHKRVVQSGISISLNEMEEILDG
ncbi:MAG: ATP-binding protein, partial [Promethearchaeota archaeon]